MKTRRGKRRGGGRGRKSRWGVEVRGRGEGSRGLEERVEEGIGKGVEGEMEEGVEEWIEEGVEDGVEERKKGWKR